jgi:hypothetical protein
MDHSTGTWFPANLSEARMNRSPRRASVGHVRVNGAVQNFEEFGKSSQCAKGTPMYPEKSCRVWQPARASASSAVNLSQDRHAHSLCRVCLELAATSSREGRLEERPIPMRRFGRGLIGALKKQ